MTKRYTHEDLRAWGASLDREQPQGLGETLLCYADDWRNEVEDSLRFEQFEDSYLHLSMLHTATMAELVETRKQMDSISKCWWMMLKHRIRVLLRMRDDE